jgi:hypothetical protein
MTLIAFAIIGVMEVSPNVCQIDYMRYVDVQSVKIPCDILTKNIVEDKYSINGIVK